MSTEWLNAQATFVCLDTTDRVQAIHQPDISLMRDKLNKSGWESCQYLNERICSVNKLIDDLEAMGSQNVIFYCQPGNHSLVKTVSSLIKKRDPSVKIIRFGPMVGGRGKALISSGGAGSYLVSDAINTIPLLLSSGGEICHQHLSGVDEIAASNYVPTVDSDEDFWETTELGDLTILSAEYKTFFTGLYNHENVSIFTEHLAVPREFTQLKSLQHLCSINASVISYPHHWEPKRYRHFRTAATEDNYYFRHFFQIIDQGDTRELYVDACSVPRIFHLFPYAQAGANGSPCLLKIETPEDLQALFNNAQNFYLTGTFSHDYELQGIISDTCRWLGKGHCPVQQLPRLFVATDGHLHPCGNTSLSIGSVGHHTQDLKAQLKSHIKTTTTNRDCANCPLQNNCSQCAFLPSFIKPSQFCSAIKQYPYLASYLYTIMVVRILQKGRSLFKSIPGTSIKVATGGSNHYVPKTIQGTGISKVKSFVYLFSLNTEPIIFDAANNKLIKISEPLATTFEALVKGIEPEEILSFLTAKYALEDGGAGRLVAQALASFQEADFLWHPPAEVSP